MISPSPPGRCFRFGVTGGIATGKTTVARMFEEWGARTIDFDRISRVVTEPGKPAFEAIVAYFGRDILEVDGTLNRKSLGAIVFCDPPKRKWLEGILHPKIYEEYHRQAELLSVQHPGGILQAVVPLLFEAHLQSWFSKIILVYATEEIQIQRVMARDHITRDRALQILRCQMPIEEKKGDADFIIDNSRSLEDTRKQAREVWNRLRALATGRKPGP
jgi:dephospho-CoA kinase